MAATTSAITEPALHGLGGSILAISMLARVSGGSTRLVGTGDSRRCTRSCRRAPDWSFVRCGWCAGMET